MNNLQTSILIENLGFWFKKTAFQKTKIFEILGFPHIEFEITGTSSKIPGISKKVWNPGFEKDPNLCISIGFHRYLRRLIGTYYMPV